MKRATKLYFFLSLIIFLVSCSNRESYSDLQKKEEKTIKTFIELNKIKVVTVLPETWEENTYFLTPNGLYIHISSIGDETISTTNISRARVGIRTLEYKLDENKTVVTDKRNADDYPIPDMLTNGDPNSNISLGRGIFEAVGYMKNKYSKASIIVPSTLNTKTYSDSLLPIGYDIEITVIQ